MRRYHEFCLDVIYSHCCRGTEQRLLGLLMSFHFPMREVAGLARVILKVRPTHEQVLSLSRTIQNTIKERACLPSLKPELRANIQAWKSRITQE